MSIPELFHRLKPLYPRAIERLWIEYQTAEPDRRREIDELLTILAIKRQGMMVGDERLVLDAPPPSLIGDGDVTVGMVSYPGLQPYPFRVRRNELLRHVFVLGPTGTGKSTLLLNLILQLGTLGVPCMIFDFKRNYRCLLHASKHVIVCTVGRNTAPLRINALTPPRGVAFEEWASALSDVISTSYLLLQGARNVLKAALLAAAREHGSSATLAHAVTHLRLELSATRAGSRKYGWLESSTRALDELTAGAFGQALNATSGTSVEDLLTRTLIFELHGLGDDQRRFFCVFVLQAVLLLRKNSAAPREVLRHLLVFDEAHNVFPRERLGDVSIPARLAREIREYGEGIVAATQQADVSESLIANSGFKLILRCDYPKDVQFASQLLQIDARWLPKLPLGSGIARLPVRCYTPILFTFGPQPIKNQLVTDTTVRQHWERNALPHSTAPETRITEHEQALLRDIALHPISPVTQRYDRLGWNPKTGNTVKDALLAKGLAHYERIRTPTGQVKLLSLTTIAREHLERAGITRAHGRRGGLEHEYWKHTLAEQLRAKGFVVTPEHPIGAGKTVDLHAARGERVLFIEVETGRSDIPANIAKCASLPGEVVFVFTNTRVRDEHAPTIRALRRARAITTADLHTL